MPLRVWLLGAGLSTCAILGGCSSYTNVSTVQIISKVAGDSQAAVAGTVLPVRPAVQVTGSTGATISGVTIVFTVISGGGSITGGTAVTGADGVATAGDWKLGATPGTNDLTAGVSNASVHFVATGLPASDTLPGQTASISHHAP